MTIIILTVSTTLIAQQEIIVASEEWEECTNADGTGLYWEILELVYPNYEVKHKLVPYSRSVNLVKNKEADLFVASYYEETDGVLYPEKDMYFDADVVVAVYKKGSSLDGANSLDGKDVGWIRGYAYNDYFDVQMNEQLVNKRKQAINMLKNDRIDYFLDAKVEVENMDKSLLEGLEYKPVKNLYLYYAFADNEKGKELLNIFETNMEKAVKSGKIKQLFEKWEFDYLW